MYYDIPKTYTEGQMEHLVEIIKGQVLVRIHDIEKDHIKMRDELFTMKLAVVLFGFTLIVMLWPFAMEAIK